MGINYYKKLLLVKIKKGNWFFMKKKKICTNFIHQDLQDAKNIIYDPSGFKCSQPIMEQEGAKYGAYRGFGKQITILAGGILCE